MTLMKALVLDTAGNSPSPAVRQVPVPALGRGDVLVEVAACGMCYHDVAVIRGVLRRGVKADVILGHEISGRVADTGEAVTSLHPGDRVTSTLSTFCGKCELCATGREYRCLEGQGIGHAIDGGFAEFVRLPESSLLPVPDGIDLESASILGCPMGVALQALQDVANVRAGETVLVTGAGGGLGVHAAQIAAALGARVLAVTTSPDKVEPLEGLGFGEVILAGELDFSEIALALTEDSGVDVVVDTVGSATFRSSLRSLEQFGRIVLLGEITGERVSLNLAEIMFRDASVIGSTGAGPMQIRAVAEMVQSGLVAPVVSQRFALEDVDVACQLMLDRKVFGRLLLKP